MKTCFLIFLKLCGFRRYIFFEHRQQHSRGSALVLANQGPLFSSNSWLSSKCFAYSLPYISSECSLMLPTVSNSCSRCFLVGAWFSAVFLSVLLHFLVLHGVLRCSSDVINPGTPPWCGHRLRCAPSIGYFFAISDRFAAYFFRHLLLFLCFSGSGFAPKKAKKG